jgi:acetylglutamate kinase
LRVTDDESLDVAEMVLSGWVNKRLVARLVAAGVPAAGLSGVDNGLFRVVKMAHHTFDLGWVGDIAQTHPADVEALLERGVTPVISPISLGLDGHTYNVNADHAASALACALGAGELVFVSNVPGVLVRGNVPGVLVRGNVPGVLVRGNVPGVLVRGNVPGALVRGNVPGVLVRDNVPGVLVGSGAPGDLAGGDGDDEAAECVPALTPEQVDALIASGEIDGGMVPKVRSALGALERGVPRVRITNLDGLCVDGGTCFLEEERSAASFSP